MSISCQGNLCDLSLYSSVTELVGRELQVEGPRLAQSGIKLGRPRFFNEEIDGVPGLHRIRSMDITTEALDCLSAGRMANVAVVRDWELLCEIARLAEDGPPVGLASSDPKLF